MKKAITTLALVAVVLLTSSFESISNLSSDVTVGPPSQYVGGGRKQDVTLGPPTTGGVYIGGGRKQDLVGPPTTGGVYIGGGRKQDMSQTSSFASDTQFISDVRKAD